jgi:uncharacterized membrane protein
MKAVIWVPVTIAILARAHRRKSLTPLGLLAAAITAAVHALPHSPLPFTLLGTFFIIGTSATKVKHAEKAKLTLSSSGGSGGEGARTHVQVLANSACASVLCLVEFLMRKDRPIGSTEECFSLRSNSSQSPFLDICLMGVVANYAAVAADTFSSELGILSRSKPFLITDLRRKVPKGTNGGITPAGVAYGHLGALAIAVTSVMLLPFCAEWGFNSRALFVACVSAWGTVGSLLDSLLGALLQASVIDRRTGKIVEGAGGVKVKTRSGSVGVAEGNHATGPHDTAARQRKVGAGTETKSIEANGHDSRLINSGKDVLDNNGINILMAAIMTTGGIVLGQMGRALV